MVSWCVGGFLAGKLSARIAPRFIVRIAAALLFVGFAVLSLMLDRKAQSKSLIVLYIGYGVLVGLGDGMVYNTVLSCVLKWYEKGTGLAAGILLFGFGFGALALGWFVNFLIDTVGGIKWTFIVLGALMAGITLTCSVLMVPPDKVISKKEEVKSEENKREYRLGEMLGTPAFWFVALWQVAVATVSLLVINSAANIALAFGLPALLGLMVSVFNGLARPFVGSLFDRLGRNAAMLIDTAFVLAGGTALLLATLSKNGALGVAGLALIGMGYGGAAACSSTTINRFFGQKYYGVNLAANNFIMVPAALIGPLVSSRLQEVSGGDFLTTFILTLAVAVVGFLLSFGLTATARKHGLERPARR
jgi:OFA family oxalate/formate antiporter-like MFS transporter